jgi:hypothetical protein
VADADTVVAPEPGQGLLALDAAPRPLAEHDPLKAKPVELRYFTGPTGDRAAAALGVSGSTADRLWVLTRAWLRPEPGFGTDSSGRRICISRFFDWPARIGYDVVGSVLRPAGRPSQIPMSVTGVPPATPDVCLPGFT